MNAELTGEDTSPSESLQWVSIEWVIGLKLRISSIHLCTTATVLFFFPVIAFNLNL
jgi:hypothetical protein